MNVSMNDRKKAVLLAAVLLVIAILCGIRIYAVSHSATGNGQALYADIYQNGELLQTIRLDTVTDEYTFALEKLHIEKEDLRTLYKNSVEISFASDSVKHQLLYLLP